MNTDFTVQNILSWLYKWRKSIIIVTLSVAVLSAIVSLLLPVYYQSSAKFYAASQDLAKPEMVFGKSTVPVQYFGTDEDIDRIISLAQSGGFLDRIIDQNNLYNHYNIDSTSARSIVDIREELLGLYDIKKTDESAISVTVMDRDPDMAHNIATSITSLIQDSGIKPIKQSQEKLISTFRQNIAKSKDEIKILTDSLRKVKRTYNILDATSQRELLSTRYSSLQSALSKSENRLNYFTKINRRDSIRKYENNTEFYKQQLADLQSDTLKNSIATFNKGVTIVEALENSVRRQERDIQDLDSRLRILNSSVNSTVPVIHITSEPEVPVIKAWPHRSLIVIVSTLIAFLGTCMFFIAREANKNIDWDKILDK